MNRRRFVASLAALSIAPFVPTPKFDVMGHMLRIWKNYSKGKSLRQLPTHIIVSKEVFEMFEDALPPVQRFNLGSGWTVLPFKACRVSVGESLRGLDYAIGGRS